MSSFETCRVILTEVFVVCFSPFQQTRRQCLSVRSLACLQIVSNSRHTIHLPVRSFVARDFGRATKQVTKELSDTHTAYVNCGISESFFLRNSFTVTSAAIYVTKIIFTVKIKFVLEYAMKTKKKSRGISLLFL